MPVDAIGVTPSVSQLSNSNLDQEDFIKLFLTELTYQDPLEPLNNREFLAQMAQFANLEQTRQTNENIDNLLAVSAANQALGLIGKQVQVSSESGQTNSGAVTSVVFSPTGALLTILLGNGSLLTDVKLSQVQLVR